GVVENRLALAARDGLVVVRHGHAWTPAARQEDVTHLWQARADAGIPAKAISPDAALAMIAAVPPASPVMQLYRTLVVDALSGGADAQETLGVLAAEIGARLLTRRFDELGLGAAEGERLRALYLTEVERRWGDDGIKRADSGNAEGLDLATLADSNAQQGPGGPRTRFLVPDPEAAAGTAGHAAGSGDAQTGAPTAERGPLARVFAATDKIGKVALAPADKLLDSLSRTRGLTTEGKQAMSAFDARRAWSAVETKNAGEELYTLALGQLGPAARRRHADSPGALAGRREHPVQRAEPRRAHAGHWRR
ncbi:MAG: hypothetical protein ACRD04_00500, partial [Terriglobales bacterium]